MTYKDVKLWEEYLVNPLIINKEQAQTFGKDNQHIDSEVPLLFLPDLGEINWTKNIRTNSSLVVLEGTTLHIRGVINAQDICAYDYIYASSIWCEEFSSFEKHLHIEKEGVFRGGFRVSGTFNTGLLMAKGECSADYLSADGPVYVNGNLFVSKRILYKTSLEVTGLMKTGGLDNKPCR